MPGKSFRNGIRRIELFDMFPNEESSGKWIESIIWEDGAAVCHRCKGKDVYYVKNARLAAIKLEQPIIQAG